jgi:hypothetical protein
VKSGFTDPAGGCDVMAVRVTIGHVTLLTYAVVLGEHSGNQLVVAGDAALALSRSIRSSLRSVPKSAGSQVEWTGPTSNVHGVFNG